MTGAVPPSEPGLTAPPQIRPAETRRPRRRWLRSVRAAALVIALPIVALAVGLLIAWIVHLIRGNPTTHPAAPVASQSASATPSAAPSQRPAPVVPAGWVTETQPPGGLTYRHPPGWIRRTASPEVLRFAPAARGSTAPGVEGVGAGIEPAADPSQAISQFAVRVYGGQPGYAATPADPVAATTPGRHAGEQQEIVTYRRSGVDVRVVIRSFRSGSRTVLVLGRAASAEPARAAQLLTLVEASLKIS